MTERLTTEEFIQRAREVHGSQYDYDRTVYVATLNKIAITCPEHGDFEQRANNHLQGKGCPECATLAIASAQSSTTEEFKGKARAVHGSRYNYDRTVYVTSKKKITITCLEHGDFKQRPNNHLQGSGCPKCAGFS